MGDKAIQLAIDEFLGFTSGGGSDEARDLDRLGLLLDRLALLQHEVRCDQFEVEVDQQDPPEQSYENIRKTISRRFPQLGYYNVAEFVTTRIADSSLMVGDVIDDLIDITIDLEKVRWYWTNTGRENALWHFSDGYHGHWRHSLRNLQSFLDLLGKR